MRRLDQDAIVFLAFLATVLIIVIGGFLTMIFLPHC